MSERNVSPKSVVAVGEIEVKDRSLNEEEKVTCIHHLKQQHLDHGMALGKNYLRWHSLRKLNV